MILNIGRYTVDNERLALSFIGLTIRICWIHLVLVPHAKRFVEIYMHLLADRGIYHYHEERKIKKQKQ